MKKAIVLSFYHPDIVKGGGQQVAINLHRALAKNNFESIFIGLDNNVPKSMRSDATSLRKMPGRSNEYVCQVNNFNTFFMLSNDTWSAKTLFKFIKDFEPNVIYVHHFLMLGLNFINDLRGALPKTKFIFTAHEFLSVCMRDGHLVKTDESVCTSHLPTDCIKCFPTFAVTDLTMRNSLFDKFFENFNKVVTPSKFMHQTLLATYPSLKGKLATIPNGSYSQVEINKFTAQTPANNKIKKIGFFGQLLADKGVYELLSAVEMLYQDQMEFFVELCGGNLKLNPQEFQEKFNQKLSSVHENYGKDRIKLTGEYKNQNVVELMSKFDILVFPSKWPETFSLVLSEALLSGATILVPEVGAFKERAKLYKDRVLTYDFADVNSLAETLKFALNKTKVNNTIKISEDLSIEGMANKYIALSK